MIKILAIFLIIFGSGLEIFYYYYRFAGDGTAWYISLSAGFALNLLMLALTLLRKNWQALILLIIVSCYSLFCTSSGAAFSLGITERKYENAKRQEQTVLKMIAEYDKEIIRLETEYSNIEKQKLSTVLTLEDRYNWKNTLARAEKRQTEIITEKTAWQKKKDQLRKSESILNLSQNIYSYFSKLFGWSAKWIQFGLQLIFSLLIAAMGPCGIIILTPQKIQSKRGPYRKTDITPWLKNWIKVNWIPIRSNRGNILLSKTAFMEFQKRQEIDFPAIIYNRILKHAEDCRVIEENKIKITDEKEVYKKITGIA